MPGLCHERLCGGCRRGRVWQPVLLRLKELAGCPRNGVRGSATTPQCSVNGGGREGVEGDTEGEQREGGGEREEVRGGGWLSPLASY